jgi:hypothetical protein
MLMHAIAVNVPNAPPLSRELVAELARVSQELGDLPFNGPWGPRKMLEQVYRARVERLNAFARKAIAENPDLGKGLERWGLP